MDVDDPVVDLVGPAGDGLEQLVAGQDGARASGERGEQADLAGRQAALDRDARCRPVVAGQRVAAAGRIDHEPPAIERERRGVVSAGGDGRAGRRRRVSPAAAQDRRDPGGQLVRVERLGQVVVGAHPQAGDPFEVAALGRGDEDRRVAALADRRQDGLAA